MGLFSRSKSLLSSGLFDGFTDCHSHILPGVDDGVQETEESLEILARYEELGVRRVWLTPHIMEDFPNTTADLKTRFERFRSFYKGSVELRLGAENMIDNLFEKRLEDNDFLTMGPNGDHLLVETSYFTPPYGFHDILEKVKSNGYYPVLAHPERYVYMTSRDYDRLKGMNILFQLNVFSLAGYYGPSVRKVAEALLKSGYYDFAGTDIHSARMLQTSLTHSISPKTFPVFKSF